MTLFVISFIAGILTVLAPCVLPLLPVVIGSSVGARSKATPYIVIGSLAFSILIFTYLLKATTAFIAIPPYVWSYISGGILFGFGLILVFPKLWESLQFVSKAGTDANKLMGTGHQKKSFWGDVIIGAALGPVFSTCSPTYLVILATVLPASFFLGTLYLLTYLAGLVSILIIIALLGQKITRKLQIAADGRGVFKKVIGVLFIIVGIFIITGLDKKLETKVLDTGWLDISQLESKLLDNVDVEEIEAKLNTNEAMNFQEEVTVPKYLQKLFSETDWSKSDPNLSNALSGGPSKDGIPALESPKFVPLADADYADSVQAIVLTNKTETKVYPYNILTWHEIVNDTFGGVPVAVTFCPLCGSAIVYNRTLPDGTVSTFGVSGSLLESNMIMYDRKTENLWQQSTGRSLAGSFFPNELSLHPLQLMTIGEVRTSFPKASIMSTDTGHNRNYYKNPYAGYDTNNAFAFEPSDIDKTLPAKSIVAVFKNDNSIPIAVPWLKLREAKEVSETISGTSYNLKVSDNGELTISDNAGSSYPFYFEMWFSFSVQHGDNSVLINLK